MVAKHEVTTVFFICFCPLFFVLTRIVSIHFSKSAMNQWTFEYSKEVYFTVSSKEGIQREVLYYHFFIGFDFIGISVKTRKTQTNRHF